MAQIEITAEMQQAKDKLHKQYKSENFIPAKNKTAEVVLNAAKECGGMNNSALAPGEVAKFFDYETYVDNAVELLDVRTTKGSNDRTYKNLYAMVEVGRLVGGEIVGKSYRMINVGGLVRRHYDLKDGKFDEETGKYVGGTAENIISKGSLNTELAEINNPLVMLETALNGVAIKCERTDSEFYYAHFEKGERIADKYDKRKGIIYEIYEEEF